MEDNTVVVDDGFFRKYRKL